MYNSEASRAEETVWLVGAGGHARVVVDILASCRCRNIFLVDDDPSRHGRLVAGHPVVGGRECLLAATRENPGLRVIAAIGSNQARALVFTWLREQHDLAVSKALHPAAVIGSEVSIGRGTVVMAGVVINPGAAVGCNVIINTHATIEHDCRLGDHVHVAPGAVLCGEVRVGAETFIGTGATVIPGISIGAGVVVGAGATVVNDIGDGLTVAGTPAAVVDRREDGQP